MMTRFWVWTLFKHDWLYWHCRPLWTQRVNDFLLRQI